MLKTNSFLNLNVRTAHEGANTLNNQLDNRFDLMYIVVRPSLRYLGSPEPKDLCRSLNVY